MPSLPLKSLRFILSHPLNQGNAAGALARYVRWQVGSRLSPGPVAVPFVDDARLLVTPGMTGATGNVYCGLHEFEDMAFVLHVLRPGDLFLDVGANVGSYTVLAGKAVGADVVSVEPVQTTFVRLLDNIRLNGIETSVDALEVCLGGEPGTVRMTVDTDTVNRVVGADDGAAGRETRDVPQMRLDDALRGRVPTVAKIDVEGYEPEVLRGAEATLANPGLKALILEILPSQVDRTGRALSEVLRSHGFVPCSYAPLERKLTPQATGEARGGGDNNAIFVRDRAWVEARVRTSRAYDVQGRAV